MPRSSPDSATVSPPIRWRASASGGRRVQGGADLLDEARPDDRLGRDEVDEPLAGLLARGERLAEQVLDVQDLDAALAHPGDELVVLPLGALDPQHVVEQQLVVVVRGQPLQAELGPVDDDRAELADLRVHAERRHQTFLLRNDLRAAAPVDESVDLLERADGGALPGRRHEFDRGVDLRAHRAGRQVHRVELGRRRPPDARLCAACPSRGRPRRRRWP